MIEETCPDSRYVCPECDEELPMPLRIPERVFYCPYAKNYFICNQCEHVWKVHDEEIAEKLHKNWDEYVDVHGLKKLRKKGK